jgi:hypothetical protein
MSPLTAFNHSPPKFKPILSFPPADLSALHRFLGMLNYYRRFLPGIAYVLQPHSPMLVPVLSLPLDTCHANHANAKSILASAVPLQHPIPSATLSLATDASDSHVGGILQQRSPGSWQPLAFFSHNFLHPSPATPHLTGSFWPPTLQFATSVLPRGLPIHPLHRS